MDVSEVHLVFGNGEKLAFLGWEFLFVTIRPILHCHYFGLVREMPLNVFLSGDFLERY